MEWMRRRQWQPWGEEPFPPQRPRVAIPSNISTSQCGASGVYGMVSGVGQAGAGGVQNNIAGYCVYVGQDALPDLALPPTAYSPTLPISISVTPPGSGVKSLYILVVRQDVYGLQSTNQFFTHLLVDNSGNNVLPPLPVPQQVRLIPMPAGRTKVMAVYPTATTDANPATNWKVWLGLTPPNPGVDVPLAVVDVSGRALNAAIGPSAVGTYYYAVGLYRGSDGALSPVVTGTVVVPGLPTTPLAVPGGYQQ